MKYRPAAIIVIVITVAVAAAPVTPRFLGRLIRHNPVIHGLAARTYRTLLYHTRLLENLLTTRADNLAATPLPVYSLWVKLDKIKRLDANLPESGRYPVKGDFEYHGKIYPVKVRYRGDMYWHWGGIQKSYRITSQKGMKFANGRTAINLINPEREVIDEVLEYWLAGRMGILSPEANIIHLRLNNNFLGVYYEVEQVNADFIANHGLEPGNIYDGDQGTLPYDQVENLWQQTTQGWRKIDSVNAPDDFTELKELIRIIADSGKPGFKQRLARILEIDKFLRLIAFVDVGSCEHIDNMHNIKLYYRLATGKFEPIVWDPSGHWIEEAAERIWDRSKNDLMLSLLAIPEFRQEKNRLLWGMLQDTASITVQTQFIDDQFSRCRNDVYADKYKDIYDYFMPMTNRGFDQRVDRLKQWVKNRNEFIMEILNTARLYVCSPAPAREDGYRKVEMLIKDESGIALRELSVQGSGRFPADAILELYYDINNNGVYDAGDRLLSSARGAARFKLTGTLVGACTSYGPPGNTRDDWSWSYLRPKLLPTRFCFFLKDRSNGSLVSAVLADGSVQVTADNSITGAAAAVVSVPDIETVLTAEERIGLTNTGGSLLP